MHPYIIRAIDVADKYFLAAAAVVLGIFLCVGGGITGTGDQNSWAKNQERFATEHKDDRLTEASAEYDLSLLTHRLIKRDVELGIASATTANRAVVNANTYLSDVKKQCKSGVTDEDKANFISCAGRAIHNHFYYTPSQEVSDNYAINRSDCDTNTYLLIDAAYQQGIAGYVVYAPSHAFFAWKTSSGEYGYWETTSRDNRGEFPDLRDSWYRKNFSLSMYKPFEPAYAEQVYKALVSDKAVRKPDISALYQRYPNDSNIADTYYYDKMRSNSVKEQDAQRLAYLIKSDITSVDKRVVLTHYFISSGKRDLALRVFSEIDLNRCGSDCFSLGSQLNKIRFKLLQKPFYLYKNQMNKYGYRENAGSFLDAFYFIFMGIVAIVLGACRALKIRSKRKEIQMKSQSSQGG